MIRKNIHEFEADLEKFSKTLDVALEKVVKKVSFDLLAKIVRKTPVDTGRARASWGMSQGHIPNKVYPEIESELSPEQAAAIAKSNIEVDFNNPYGVIWIYNNLPYIGILEHGDRNRPPHAMVALSMAEMETELASQVQGIL